MEKSKLQKVKKPPKDLIKELLKYIRKLENTSGCHNKYTLCTFYI